MKTNDKEIYKKRKFLWLWVLFLFFLVPMAGSADQPTDENTVLSDETIEYEPGCGHLRGFIYKSDDKTPLWGAQVVLQEVETRQVFRSNVTDSTGDYELLNIPEGNYVVLILTRNKIYNVKSVDFLLKIFSGKTSTLSFSLKKSMGGLWYFLLEPCCDAAVISGTALAISIFTKLKKTKEQSPTQR
jgi:hypothetical protein